MEIITVNEILTATNTTTLIDAYVELCDAITELEADLEFSQSFLPVASGRVVVFSRRNAMELSIRESLLSAMSYLHNLKVVCADELGWDTVEALHYYGA